MNGRILELAKIKAWHAGGGLVSDKAVEVIVELIVAECASIVYKTCQDGDAGAQAILYEFDIDNARSQK